MLGAVIKKILIKRAKYNDIKNKKKNILININSLKYESIKLSFKY